MKNLFHLNQSNHRSINDLITSKELNEWRGVSLDVGKNYSRNQLITWWEISSCTSSVNVIKSFLGKGQNSTLFLIQAINERNIRDYSEFQNEDEIILPLGTQFRVRADSLEQSNGSYIVDLIEINQDFSGRMFILDLINIKRSLQRYFHKGMKNFQVKLFF